MDDEHESARVFFHDAIEWPKDCMQMGIVVSYCVDQLGLAVSRKTSLESAAKYFKADEGAHESALRTAGLKVLEAKEVMGGSSRQQRAKQQQQQQLLPQEREVAAGNMMLHVVNQMGQADCMIRRAVLACSCLHIRLDSSRKTHSLLAGKAKPAKDNKAASSAAAPPDKNAADLEAPGEKLWGMGMPSWAVSPRIQL